MANDRELDNMKKKHFSTENGTYTDVALTRGPWREQPMHITEHEGGRPRFAFRKAVPLPMYSCSYDLLTSLKPGTSLLFLPGAV